MPSRSYRTERNAPQIATVRVDDRGRVTIPKKIRESLDIQEGDICFIDFEENSFRIVRGENPFSVLAGDALEQEERGETVSFDDAMEPLTSSNRTRVEGFGTDLEAPGALDLRLASPSVKLRLQQMLVEELQEATERFFSAFQQRRSQ